VYSHIYVGAPTPELYRGQDKVRLNPNRPQGTHDLLGPASVLTGPLIGQEDCQVLSKAYFYDFTLSLSLSKIMKEN
jgi:hypothetical protein